MILRWKQALLFLRPYRISYTGRLPEKQLLKLSKTEPILRVEQYLVFAEGHAMRRIPMTMEEWIIKLDGFLTLNDRNILDHAGKVSHILAKQIAEQEYQTFNHLRIERADQQDGEFEKALQRIPCKRKKTHVPHPFA